MFNDINFESKVTILGCEDPDDLHFLEQKIRPTWVNMFNSQDAIGLHFRFTAV